MKREYTRPAIVKVDLNHEQAILGACSSIATTAKDAVLSFCIAGACKADDRTSKDADSTGSS